MKKKLLALVAPVMAITFATGVVAAQGQYGSGTTGVDVSWPNCSKSIPKATFGIVGVNGGKNFSSNPCFKSQVANYKNLSLYINTGYPGQAYSLNYQNAPKACSVVDLSCLAYNYGYNAGQYSVNFVNSQGISAPTWWLDVETMNTWTSDTDQNVASMQGQIDALKDAGIQTIGVYSTTAQWNTITGGWQNGLPSWGATTWATAKQAMTYCKGHEFTGGPSYLMQYKPKQGIDQDVAC